MSFFVQTTPAPTPKTKRTQYMSLFYAGILVVFALTQLYTFDTFIELIPSFQLPLSGAWAYALAPSLVAAEVLALPFLLRMRLSPAFRGLSMFFGWLVPLVWLLISLWVVTTGRAVETIGFLGALVDLTPGAWAILLSIALGILAAWASWGMWPGAKQSNRKKAPSKK